MKQLSAFKKALLDVTLEESAEVFQAQSKEPVFSSVFEQKMDRLLQRVDNRGNYRPKVIKRRMFLIAAVIVFALAATAAAVPTIREGLIRFFTRNTGVAYTIHFQPEDVASAPKEIETFLSPSYLPSGFEVSGNVSSPSLNLWLYVNTVGDNLEYEQNKLWEDQEIITSEEIPTKMAINSEGMEVRYFVIDGYEVMAIEATDQGEAHYLWTDYNYLYSISAVPAIDTNEIIRIITSLREQ